MIRVVVTLIPFSGGDDVVLGEAVITNDATGTAQHGNYNVSLGRLDGRGVWRRGRVLHWPRVAQGPWDLLYCALRGTVAARSVESKDQQRNRLRGEGVELIRDMMVRLSRETGSDVAMDLVEKAREWLLANTNPEVEDAREKRIRKCGTCGAQQIVSPWGITCINGHEYREDAEPAAG